MLFRKRCRNAPGIETPHGALLDVRQPDSSLGGLDESAAFTNELLDDFVGFGIDARDRKALPDLRRYGVDYSDYTNGSKTLK